MKIYTDIHSLLNLKHYNMYGYFDHSAKKPKSSSKKSTRSGEDDRSDDAEDDEDLDITIPKVIIFFIMVCAFLVLLYFFYEYLGRCLHVQNVIGMYTCHCIEIYR